MIGEKKKKSKSRPRARNSKIEKVTHRFVIVFYESSRVESVLESVQLRLTD
jgi:hypothetical protein